MPLTHKGYLENVLDTDRHVSQREALVWKNFCFGRRKKNTIKFRRLMTGAAPSNYIYPELYPWLKTRVLLPQEVREHFESHKDDLTKAKRTAGRLTIG